MELDKKKLLRNFLDEQCTGEEYRIVKALLETSEGKAIMHELMQERDRQAGQYTSPGTDEENLDVRVPDWKRQVSERIARAPKAKPHRMVKMMPLRYVALWTGIILAAGFLAWQLKQPILSEQAVVRITKENRQGIPVRYVLPDSSVIYLAAGSTLSYPVSFPQSGRDVQLQGAAFFEVKRDEAHLFTITTGQMQTRVLGTSFKVSAFEGEPFEVAVATGKVAVSAWSDKEQRKLATLTPGLKINYNQETGQAETGKVAVNSLELWKSGELVFDEQPLWAVARELQRRDGVEIRYNDPETANYRVSGTFGINESAGDILEILSSLGKFKVEAQGDSIFHLCKTKTKGGNTMQE